MYHLRFRGMLCLLCLSVLIACQPDNDLTTPVEPEPELPQFNQEFPGVEEALWPYLTRFEEEAAQRGITINLVQSQITGLIEEIEATNVLGQCSYSSLHPNHVIIDRAFWNRATDLGKEFVVFHELGHCELLRDHFEAAFSNGACVSIMRSGVEGCRDNYSAATRSTYLDELFDPERAGDWLVQ